MEGINWGQHAMLSITRNNRIMGIRSLCPSVISAPKKPKNYISRAASQTDDIKRHSYELREYGKDLLNGDFSFFDKVSFQKQVNSAESRKISAISKALAAYRTEEWQTIVDLLESDEAELPEGMLKILNIARDKVQQTTGVRKFLSSLFGKR